MGIPGNNDTAETWSLPETGRLGVVEAGDAALCLDVVHSPDPDARGRRVPLTWELVAGRRGGAEVGLALDDRAMSRRHAFFRPGPWRVEDLDSRNGTWVNGERVREGRVSIGDVVRMGETVCVVARRPRSVPALPPGVVARSAALLARIEEALGHARGSSPVVLLGETGTGKEVFARLLHDQSGRKGRFVAVNCAAIPRNLVESTLFGYRAGAFTGASTSGVGLFAEARGGTLFLDEIGELPSSQQGKFLRVLETGEFMPVGSARAETGDARIVCATNLDLAAEVAAGHFRKDLYARLAETVLRLPPLRERREDIVPLARHFVEGGAEWTAGFVESLLLYPWPLNARGLRSVMLQLQRASDEASFTRSKLSGVLGEHGLPMGDDASSPHPAELESAARPTRSNAPEEAELRDLLSQHRGNITAVSRHFGRAPRQIYRWMRYLGIGVDEYRP